MLSHSPSIKNGVTMRELPPRLAPRPFNSTLAGRNSGSDIVVVAENPTRPGRGRWSPSSVYEERAVTRTAVVKPSDRSVDVQLG